MRGLTIRAAALAGGLAAVLALGGCATLSADECRAADWTALGRSDGAKGARAEQLEQHRKACARHGVEPQEAAWRAGYAKGLAEFCTPRGGYLAGRDDVGHAQACDSQPRKEQFLQAHQRGKEVHKLRDRIVTLRQAMRDLEMAVLSGDYNDYETTQARMKIGALESEIDSSEWELERLDREYAREYGAEPLRKTDLR